MHVILSVVTDSPYREAVDSFSQNFADLLDGRVRLATLGQRVHAGSEPDPLLSEQDQEGLLERREEAAQSEFEKLDNGAGTPHEVIWLGGPPVEECIREMAKSDFGVVGKTFTGEPTALSALGPEVSQLKQSCTKPIIIVPKTVRPIKRVLFVYTDHPESGHALYLANPMAAKGVGISLLTAIPPLGKTELIAAGTGYLEAHGVEHETVDFECDDCEPGVGPSQSVLQVAAQEEADFIIMGGTRRSFLGNLLWPELARDVAGNADVPVLVWY